MSLSAELLPCVGVPGMRPETWSYKADSSLTWISDISLETKCAGTHGAGDMTETYGA